MILAPPVCRWSFIFHSFLRHQQDLVSLFFIDSQCYFSGFAPYYSRFNSIYQPGKVLLEMVTDVTLPNCQHVPSLRHKLFCMDLVPLPVPSNLFHPEFGIRLWDTGIFTTYMTMLETAMHENNGPVPG